MQEINNVADNHYWYKKRKKKRRKLFDTETDELPDNILAIPNKDKTFQEVWYKGRNLLNFPHSWRAVVSARVGAGKSTILKNILLRQDPPFKKIYVVHIDPDSKDYEEVDGVEMLEHIPSVRDNIFKEKHKRVLLILDDLEYKFLDKQQLRNLDRIWGYGSSHLGVSCAVLAQDVYNIPPCIRRMSNIWILGKINNDLSSFMTIAQRCGMEQDDFVYVYDKYIHGDHDMLWIDRTKDSPAEFRINGYTVLDKHNRYEPMQAKSDIKGKKRKIYDATKDDDE